MESELKLHVFNRIRDVDTVAWDRLAEIAAYSSTRWMAFCEQVIAHETPYYLVVEQAGVYIGAAVCWLYRQPKIPDFPSFVEKWLSPIFARRPLLICEIPYPAASGLILGQQPETVFAMLRRGMRQIAVREKASFTIFGHLNQNVAFQPDWPDAFNLVRLFPGTQMNLADTADYEGYLSRLNKKQRKNIRRNRRAAEESGVRVRIAAEMEPELAFLLAQSLAARHGGVLKEETRRLFAYAGMVDACWLQAEKDGRIVGFDLLLRDRDVWTVHMTGNDYSSSHVYFLLSDEDIRLAMDRQARMLYAGTHLYHVKLRLGYEPRLDGYVRYAGMSGFWRLLSRLVSLRQRPPSSVDQPDTV